MARSARIFDRSMDKDWLTKADLPYKEAKKSKQRRSSEMSFASSCFRFLTNIVEDHKFIYHRRHYRLDSRSQIHRVDHVANTLQIRDSSEIVTISLALFTITRKASYLSLSLSLSLSSSLNFSKSSMKIHRFVFTSSVD